MSIFVNNLGKFIYIYISLVYLLIYKLINLSISVFNHLSIYLHDKIIDLTTLASANLSRSGVVEVLDSAVVVVLLLDESRTASCCCCCWSADDTKFAANNSASSHGDGV